MKRLVLLGFFALSACGSGGGGGSAAPPAPTPTPIANTSSPHYLPLANGNSWTFASGGKMVDMGSSTLSCGCPGNGDTMERIALYPPGSSTISSSFFFTKTPPSGQYGELSNIVGVENDSGTNNVTVISNVQFPNGVPIMDDSPSANEFWNDGAGDQSTITSVGGTLMLPSGSEVIDVAEDQITGSFSSITWDFAKGVGFTQIGVGGQSTTLTSFSVNAASSMVRTSASHVRGEAGTIDFEHSLAALFK